MKGKTKTPNDTPKWMRDRDLTKTMFVILLLILGLYVMVIEILIQVSPKGFLYLLAPFAYLLNLYQLASPGEKLSIIFVLIGGVGGWFLKQWTAKKQE